MQISSFSCGAGVEDAHDSSDLSSEGLRRLLATDNHEMALSHGFSNEGDLLYCGGVKEECSKVIYVYITI